MGAPLPNLSPERFARRLRAATSEPLASEAITRLFAHHEELRRWNVHLSLIGPGTVSEVVEIHYAESLEGRALLRATDRTLVDLGSGAGFPGVPLAAALPSLEVWLVEPQSRKWAFLRSATETAGIPCHCLDARVDRELPEEFPQRIDVVTVRALKLAPRAWVSIRARLSRRGRLLRWGSGEPPAELDGWKIARRVRLPGRERWILELKVER